MLYCQKHAHESDMPYTKEQLLLDTKTLLVSDRNSVRLRVSKALSASVLEGDGLLKLFEETLPRQTIELLLGFSEQTEFQNAKTPAEINKRRSKATKITARFLQAAALAPDESLSVMVNSLVALGRDAKNNGRLQGVVGLSGVRNNVNQLVLLSLAGGFQGKNPLPEQARILKAMQEGCPSNIWAPETAAQPMY